MDSSMRGYHFLCEKYALAAIRDRRLKVARLSEMNDPFELLSATSTSPRIRGVLRKAKMQMNTRWGALCFSGCWKHPLLWSHYADKHKGICLGFDISEQGRNSITYISDRIKFDQVTPHRNEKMLLRQLTTKYKAWRYEDEIRVLVNLAIAIKKEDFYFQGFGPDLWLRKVILGPANTMSARAVEKALSGYSGNVEFQKARLGFTKFEIVNQRDRRHWEDPLHPYD